MAKKGILGREKCFKLDRGAWEELCRDYSGNAGRSSSASDILKISPNPPPTYYKTIMTNTILDEPYRFSMLVEQWCLEAYPALRQKVRIFASHPRGQHIADMWAALVEVRIGKEYYLPVDGALAPYSLFQMIDITAVRMHASSGDLKQFLIHQLRPVLNEAFDIVSVRSIMES